MQKTKIVIFIPSIDRGGAEKNLFIIANYLSQKFKKISVVTTSKSSKKKFSKNVEFLSTSSFFWEKFGRLVKTLISVVILIKILFKEKNVLILSFQSNIFAIILCTIFKKKIITRSNSFPNDWTKSDLKKYLFKKIYPLAEHNVVNSLQAKKSFLKYYKIKSTCIYNPLDIQRIKHLSKEKVPKIFKKNKLKIINIGRLSEEKDHITFLKALQLLENQIKYEAVIMGRGKLKNKLENFIKENDLKKNIKLIGYKSNPYPYIKQSDFVILTSLHEGLPNVLLEALILKKFVISSNCVSGPKEILSNGNGGALFKVRNYKELKKLIIFYNKNRKISNKKIKFGLNNIYRFNYKNNLNLYSSVITNIIKL